MENKRGFVLELSVRLESDITSYLGEVLKIDPKTSNVIGANGNSLSFSKKLTMLEESKNLNKEERMKFDIFSVVRNKFAHLIAVVDFESCFTLFPHNYVKLKEYYWDKEKLFRSKEEEIHSYFQMLYDDLSQIINDKYVQQGLYNTFAPMDDEIAEIYDLIYIEHQSGNPRASKVINYFEEVKKRKINAGL